MTNHHPDCDVWNATLHNDTIDAYGLDDPKVDPADYQCNSGCSPQIGYEYNVYDTTMYGSAAGMDVPGLIAVCRHALLMSDDGVRYSKYDRGEEAWAYAYAPDTADPEASTVDGQIDYVEDRYFDFDDPDLPWFAPLLDFDKGD